MLATQNPLAITSELLCLVRDPYEVENGMFDLEHSFVYPRLNSWLCFFNEHYSKSLLLYSKTILALLETAKEGRLLQEQTRNEFEISIEFYKTIFDSLPDVQVESQEEAKLLLNISLIYGKYPGMVIRSLRSSLQVLAHGVSIDSLHELFNALFVKYEKPTLFLQNLNHLSTSELDFLMFILQGNSPRLYPNLPFQLSRKENYFLNVLIAEEIDLKRDILKKLLVFSKLMLVNADPFMIHCFTQNNHYFQYRINEFYREIEFWKSALRFISKIDFEVNEHGIGAFVDYFAFVRHTARMNYSFKGRTVGSVSAAITLWHEEAEYTNNQYYLDSNWGKSEAQTFRFRQESYLIKEITNGMELFQESENMKHCAFSYIENCLKGYTSIWSIKKSIGGSFKPYLTVEIQRKSIVQVALKRNGVPSKEDVAMLKEWAGEAGFVVL